MPIEIFWGSGSPFSWRVLLALEWKRVPYESHRLEFSRGEHRAPDFLAVNPRGQVPALRDGAFVLAESVAILAYLDDRYPQPPLFGSGPDERALVWQGVQECALYLDGPVEDFVLPVYEGEAAVAARGAQVQAALPRIHEELGRWERALGFRPWLVLGEVSAADLAVYPMLKSALRAAGKPAAAALGADLLPLERRYPRLTAWMARIEALPGYERTYPPHWRAA